MNELEKARSIEVSGEVRQKILERYNSQIARWNIAVPETEPLVLDFGLGRFESVGVVECWIANEIEAGYCGKYLFLFNGQTCPMHYHKNKHETFFLMEGGLRVILNGKQIDLKKGDVLTIPTLAKHSLTGIGSALLMELSQPCIIQDNYFENINIPTGENSWNQG